jgi:hypothetical protein
MLRKSLMVLGVEVEPTSHSAVDLVTDQSHQLGAN